MTSRPWLWGSLLVIVACGPKAPASTSAVGSGATTQPPVSTTPIAPLAPSATPVETIDHAAQLIASRNVESVRQGMELLRGVQNEPHAEVPYNMGVAYEFLGDLDNAKLQYLHATEIDPKLGVAWLNLGGLTERSGNPTQALQYYEAGLRSEPDNGDLVVGEVGALRKLGRYDEAIAKAKTALGKNAYNVNIYNNLGLVYLDQGNPSLALFVFQKALNSIKDAENNAALRTNLGRVYLAKGDRFNARSELEKAMALDTRLVAPRLYLAQYYLDNHDWQGAASLLEPARDLEPENPSIHQNLGIAYRGLGRYDEARKAYEKALSLDTANKEPMLNIAILEADYQKNLDAAVSTLQAYKSAGGKDPATADKRIADIQKQKELLQKAEERRLKAEQRKKDQEERERLAREHEANEAKRAQEEAAGTTGTDGGAAPPGPAPAPGGTEGSTAPAPEGTPSPEGGQP